MRPPYHRKLSPEPMRVLLRHAEAHDRRQWTGPDGRRGLTDDGWDQAEALVPHLAGLPITRVLSGPDRHCRQTVLPLAWALALPVEPCRLLGPGGDPGALAAFLAAEASANAVLCTHQDVLLGAFAELAGRGSRLVDGLAPMEPAAVWLVFTPPGQPPRVRYLHSAVPGVPDRVDRAG